MWPEQRNKHQKSSVTPTQIHRFFYNQTNKQKQKKRRTKKGEHFSLKNRIWPKQKQTIICVSPNQIFFVFLFFQRQSVICRLLFVQSVHFLIIITYFASVLWHIFIAKHFTEKVYKSLNQLMNYSTDLKEHRSTIALATQ